MESTEPSALGTWIRQRREMKGLTQEDLATRAGLTKAGIASIERGRRQRPYPHTMRALASALELSEDERSELLAMTSITAPGIAPVDFGPVPTLSASPSPLIGRHQALADIQALLQNAHTRLVTLTGPGGVGKTSLALEFTRRAKDAFPDGVVVVPLESLDNPALLLSWIGGSVGMTGMSPGSEAAALQGYFGDRKPLLILDNFEHLLPAARELALLLAACPELKVLVTSRAPLRIRGEQEFPVGPLTVPNLRHIPSPEELALSGAVQLFTERAQASNPAFMLTQENAAAVTAICRRLDGLPLALELAAARLRILSPTELLARLDQALPVLTGGARDLPERQRTMHDTIAWSYQLLAPIEQSLFRRHSVFVGGWDAEAAEAIAKGIAFGGDSPLDVLSRLVEHSLVIAETDESGSTRYRMLDTIREFGRDLLNSSGEAHDVACAHAQWCLALAEKASEYYYGPLESAWLDRLEREHPNIRAAVAHAFEVQDHPLLLRLVSALGRLWLKREHFGQGIAWMERTVHIVHQTDPSPEGALVLFNLGRLIWDQGKLDTGMTLLRESLSAWQQLGDERRACSATIILGNSLRLRGETEEAFRLLTESRSRLEEFGDEPLWLSTALRMLGIMALERQDWDASQALLEQALEEARISTYPWAIGSALHNLAHLQHLRHDHERSLVLFLESLRLSLDDRDYWALAVTFPPVAEVLVSLGETEQAARLFGAASSLAETMFARLSATVPVVESQEQARAFARGALGEATFQLLYNDGRSLTPQEALEEIRQTARRRTERTGTVTTTTALPNGLTLREVEVIALVADGMTNGEVADRLYLSRRTVDAHLRRIYDKLDLSSRTEIVRFAHDHQLV